MKRQHSLIIKDSGGRLYSQLLKLHSVKGLYCLTLLPASSLIHWKFEIKKFLKLESLKLK